LSQKPLKGEVRAKEVNKSQKEKAVAVSSLGKLREGQREIWPKLKVRFSNKWKQGKTKKSEGWKEEVRRGQVLEKKREWYL